MRRVRTDRCTSAPSGKPATKAASTRASTDDIAARLSRGGPPLPPAAAPIHDAGVAHLDDPTALAFATDPVLRDEARDIELDWPFDAEKLRGFLAP